MSKSPPLNWKAVGSRPIIMMICARCLTVRQFYPDQKNKQKIRMQPLNRDTAAVLLCNE